MTSSSTIFCPGCGVAVTVGYTRCPRCHAPMPSARIKRESMQAGGTSLETLETPAAGRGLWIAGAILVLIGVGVAIIALGGGNHKKAAAAEEDETEPAGGSEVAPLEEAPVPPIAPVRLDPLGAADRLERQLATERFFAKSTLRGTDLELRSEFCAQGRLRAIIASSAEDLRTQGLVTIRCVELHGAEVFAQAL